MKLLLIGLALLALAGCSEKDLRQAIEIIDSSVEEAPLTRSEVVAALKDSLSRGISKGALIASSKNGYYGNPELRAWAKRSIVSSGSSTAARNWPRQRPGRYLSSLLAR
jgi:type IV pilus biogenesis protein CpaD/CtpE